jgi:hypothetical protein
MTDPSGQRERMLRGDPYLATDPELAPGPAGVLAVGTPCRVVRPL